MIPDVDISSALGAGALKGYFAQDALAPDVGPSMAALVHYYRAHVLGHANVLPRLCLLYEARTGRLHSAGRRTSLLTKVEVACQLTAALWPTL